MADSATSKLLSTIKKFDGTNWETWAFSIKAAFMFIDALNIAEGTEKEPPLSIPSKEEEHRLLEDWKRRSRQGLSLLLVSVKPTVHQSLDMAKSLRENWSTLKAAYGTRTRLNLWVDYRQYTTTTFSTAESLTQQIDAMSDLKNRIAQAGLPITDSLHTLNVLQALPTSYEIVQQRILAVVTDFSTISWSDI